MKIKVFTKAPMFWTFDEWKMSQKDREKVGIKFIEINI